jgi:ring-1,2-phenylacetyl-CoA epoxidase subunit PaaD
VVKVLSEIDIRTTLASVKDPEIPVCSITDLGMVHDVRVPDGEIEVDLLPTFVGCPALDVIREDVEAAVRALAPNVEVRVRFITSPPWTTDRITPEGKEALRTYGIAPPGEAVLVRFGKPEPVTCPYCGSEQTVEEGAFGPTPCRTVRYCPACKNPFEGFKRKGA